MEGEEHGGEKLARMMNGGLDGYKLVSPSQGNEKGCEACGDHASLHESPQQRSTLPEQLPLRLKNGDDAGCGVHRQKQRGLISSAVVSFLVIFSFLLLLRSELATPIWISLEISTLNDVAPSVQQGTQISNTNLSETPPQRPPLACGNWQEEYISLHRDILSGRVPPRFLVSVEVEAGTADRLTGILSEFYFALLTRRAFLIHHAHQPAFEEAFDAPFVNWTLPNADGDESLQQLHPEFIDDEVLLNYIGVVTDNRTDDFYVQDLTTLPLNHSQDSVLFIASNRGRTYGLFENPYHGDQLRAWGLTPETAFACAFNFLFRPNAATLASVQSELRELRKDDTALKIGIKIRIGGDRVELEQDGDNRPLRDADLYLNCAEEVERTRKKGEQRVLWYVMSESLSLRVQIKDKYGDKVVCNTTQRVRHTNCLQFGTCNGERDTPADRLRYAAGQIYAFSLTDVQISTRDSGFGRMGAWLSKAQDGYNHTFAFYEMADANCVVTPPSISAKSWAGV